MKNKKTKEEAAAQAPKSKAKVGKLRLNKETFQDMIAPDADKIKGGGIKTDMGGACCWVARAVYGEDNPRWLLFREWLLSDAPAWFRDLYIRHGERFAPWVAPHASINFVIRLWMDSVIDRKHAAVRLDAMGCPL